MFSCCFEVAGGDDDIDLATLTQNNEDLEDQLRTQAIKYEQESKSNNNNTKSNSKSQDQHDENKFSLGPEIYTFDQDDDYEFGDDNTIENFDNVKLKSKDNSNKNNRDNNKLKCKRGDRKDR